ncbi:hypothetical protein EXN70_31100 [Rhizobium rhizogenes]|nr:MULTISPECIES: nuclear transport factor 2 family protein [Rhizobium/Agrobacterium group]TRB17817.1 hypothetical protein EXN70_31100 [Rhizobium rhizogenes]
MLQVSNFTGDGAPSPIRLRALSLGAGVQSTTMAPIAAHGEVGPMPDCAIFADTGWEPKAVYDHLEWLMSPNVLPFPVHVVSAGNIRDNLMDAAAGKRWASIPAFAKTVTPAVAGDTSVVPWIGRKIGKAGAAEFYAQIREQIASEAFAVREILSQGNRVIAIGELASRVLRTGKLIESEFCFDFTVENGEITRFRLFEDSFAVAKAAV